MSGNPAAFDAKMRLMAAAARACAAFDRGDLPAMSVAQTEADEARIALCAALGDVESERYWTERRG